MVKNRSGYGPLSEYWYSQYILQFEKKDNIGLVGSTIKLTGHPKHKSDGLNIHVQTYVYLTKWKIISQFINNFPGSPFKDRLSVIVNGEIKLSRILMEKGYGLICLYWPDHFFYQHTNSVASGLPKNDVKKNAYSVPIRYKFARYTRNFKAIILIIMWKCRIMKKKEWFDNEIFVFTDRYGKITE